MASIASNRRIMLVWLGLVLATVLSWAMAHDDDASGQADHRLLASVVVIAFLKVRFVGIHFMGLRTAPRGLRLAFDAWVLAVGGTLLYLATGYRP